MVRMLSLKSALCIFKFKQLALPVSIACAGIVYFLLTRIDLIVHGELYGFGLVFSAQWADSYRVLMLSIYVCSVIPVVLSGAVLVSGRLERKQKVSAGPSLLERARKVASAKLLPLKLPVEVGEASECPQRLSGEHLRLEDRPVKALEDQTFPKRSRRELAEFSWVEIQGEREPQVVAGSELKRENRLSDVIISCPECKRTFHRPLVMLDFSGAKPGLVNVCPYCNQVLGSSQAEMDVYSDAFVKDEVVKYGNV